MGKKRKKKEFSKIILALIMSSYFAVLIFGMLMIVYTADIYRATALCGLFTFTGGASASAIAFYSNKAKAENVEKIKNSKWV